MEVHKVYSQYICQGEPYNISAIVKAYNQGSAQITLDWIVQNKHCMCQSCMATYQIEYLTKVILPNEMPIYRMCVKR